MRWLSAAALFVALLTAACGRGGESAPPPEGVSGPGAYIALGDSLSEGVGASVRGESDFVSRVWDGLPGKLELLTIFFALVLPGTCPALKEALAKPVCVGALRDALDEFRPNLAEAIGRLQAADADLPIALMTLYNPFSGGLQPVDEVAELALEGASGTAFAEGLNDMIRAEGRGQGVILVEWYPLFEGKAGRYIYDDLIHPNDEGHRMMAEAV